MRYKDYKFDHQVIRYAKHWYKETDMFQDLAVLVRDHYGIEPSEDDIARLVYDITAKFISAKQSALRDDFMFDLNPKNLWKFNRQCQYKDAFCYQLTANCLSKLSAWVSGQMIIEVLGEELEEPNYSILPPRTEG